MNVCILGLTLFLSAKAKSNLHISRLVRLNWARRSDDTSCSRVVGCTDKVTVCSFGGGTGCNGFQQFYLSQCAVWVICVCRVCGVCQGLFDTCTGEEWQPEAELGHNFCPLKVH